MKRLFGTSYLYDMDSSMAEQIIEKYPASRVLGRWLRWSEGLAIRHAEAVVPVCDALAQIASRYHPKRLVVLRDISLLSRNGQPTPSSGSVKQDLGLSGPIVMYVGNLERYQGIDLLLESFAIAHRRIPTACLVIIGGQPAHIRLYQREAQARGLDHAVHFLGPRPVAQMADYLEAADVLVSPRLAGGNTPMKIYSYLDAGKAVLATALPTHTQLLTDEVAMLKPSTPEAFADGLAQLLEDHLLRQRLGQAGQALVAQRHNYHTFQSTLNALYSDIAHTVRR
jgi:glycosyltransferase involved in cell wall biosynthesis